jgi:molecular chaperone DnaK
MAVFGFDFGTTNSLISIIKGNKPINVFDPDNGLPFPSVVCYEGSKIIVGSEAKKRIGEAGLSIKGNIVKSPKRYLGEETIFVDGVERSPVDIVSDVVRFVAQQNNLSAININDSIKDAVVTIPVDMTGNQRRSLRDAFLRAGINIEQFIHEPLAALYGFIKSQDNPMSELRMIDRKFILVFDWGGGTLDLTLCRVIDGMLVQVANDGTDDVGGDVLDDAIRNAIIKQVLKDRGMDESINIDQNALKRLLHECERAKIALSKRDKVSIYVGGFFKDTSDDDFDYLLTREELIKIITPLLHKGFSRIKKILELGDLSPVQIYTCVATGGTVNMPIIKSMMTELFGPQRVHITERSATLVAEGAAWIAHDKSRLRLAKNIEVLLARNSYMKLLEQGVVMPKRGKVCKQDLDLYCTDPRDGYAKVEICVTASLKKDPMPNSRRLSLGILKASIDSRALPFFERLKLVIEIDDNLILNVRIVSTLTSEESQNLEIHNLEFGISLPTGTKVSGGSGVNDEFHIDENKDEGSIVFRSNISNKKDKSLVPGELVMSYDPLYFDDRFTYKATQTQEKEASYYMPCARCKRLSNDPLCNCDSAVNAKS